MAYDPDDTIAAIGTASGGALRGMVRLSGPLVLDCLTTCFQPDDSVVNLKEICSPTVIQGTVSTTKPKSVSIACDLCVWPTDRSYTRQPTAELHTIGSPPLLESLLRTVCNAGARLAEPGEFTLRAFLAGRLDLTQAEAVLGIIDAQSSTDLHTALSQLAGGLSQPLTRLREELLQLLAELEAGLDFVEEDIEFITAEQLRQQLNAAQTIVADITEQLASREDASDLPRIVLTGPPNAGKSSLFNALVERYATVAFERQSLVSDQSGTTRDFVTAIISLDGLDCKLIDTAGVDKPTEKNSSIDEIAQVMTGKQREQADLVVCCKEASSTLVDDASAESTNDILVLTKSDLLSPVPANLTMRLLCSSVNGSGLKALAQQIGEKLCDGASDLHSPLSLTASRCAESLQQANTFFSRALQLVEFGGGEELVAAEVRGALQALGQVVGAVYTDDILDRIFGQFCIGK